MSSGTIVIMDLMVALNGDMFLSLSPNTLFPLSYASIELFYRYFEILHCIEILIAKMNLKNDHRCWNVYIPGNLRFPLINSCCRLGMRFSCTIPRTIDGMIICRTGPLPVTLLPWKWPLCFCCKTNSLCHGHSFLKSQKNFTETCVFLMDGQFSPNGKFHISYTFSP